MPTYPFYWLQIKSLFTKNSKSKGKGGGGGGGGSGDSGAPKGFFTGGAAIPPPTSWEIVADDDAEAIQAKSESDFVDTMLANKMVRRQLENYIAQKKGVTPP